MKKLIYGGAVIILIGMVIFGCQKDNIKPSTTNSNSSQEVKMIWRTPNGVMIPYSERNHWKKYLRETAVNVSYTKSSGGGIGVGTGLMKGPGDYPYQSYDCTTANGNAGLYCTTSKHGDCANKFDCTTCANCGV